MKRPLALSAALALVCGCGPETIGEDWRPLSPRVEAPDFTLPALEGDDVTLSDYRGRVVIMEFWATWCGPCRMSTPSLEVIAKQHRDKPVTVLLVNAGESPDQIRTWAGKRFTATILLDPDGAAARRYRVEGIPQLFIIDPEGRIIYDHGGYQGGLERNLRNVLDGLLAEREAAHDA